MQNNKTNTLMLAGLLIAIGLILPFVTSHAFGIPGAILLPMHLPVFLLGLLCGPYCGLLGGLVIPVMSSLLTGMPPMFPMLPIMAGELMTYGLISGVLHRKVKLSIFPSLLIAMLCGRVSYGVIYAALLMANNGTLRAASVGTAIMAGMPGIIIQLVLIPAIVKIIQHRPKNNKSIVDDRHNEKYHPVLKSGVVTCIVMKNNKVVYQADGRGVKPILNLLHTQPELLQGAHIVDKIIGKAAALLLVKGGAISVYGELMSVSAYEYLRSRDIKAEYGRCIDVISNREGNGICPLEKSVKDIDEPDEAYSVLQKTIRQLMGA